jgi:hypothetical protein
MRTYVALDSFVRSILLLQLGHEGFISNKEPFGRPTTNIIDALVADASRGSGTFELPDLLRTRAGVLLETSPANWPAAEASLTGSLDCARQQSALGWELRSAIALSRLWVNHGRVDEARSLLTGVYERFTEGFGTADLTEMSRQLRALGARTSHS